MPLGLIFHKKGLFGAVLCPKKSKINKTIPKIDIFLYKMAKRVKK